MVRVTLKTTLTTIQNRHPGPTRRNGNRPSLAWHRSYPSGGPKQPLVIFVQTL